MRARSRAGIDARGARPLRRYQPFILIEPDGARGHPQFLRQFRHGVELPSRHASSDIAA